MKTLNFSIEIKAPKEKVWNTMLDDATYREWSKAFGEGGYYEGDWSKGSKMRFLGADPDSGEIMGMVSKVAENNPYDFVSVEHVGIVANGVDDTTSEEARKWSPAFENYTFVEKDGGTEVQVSLDVLPEYAEMFEKMWPDALQRLKGLVEA